MDQLRFIATCMAASTLSLNLVQAAEGPSPYIDAQHFVAVTAQKNIEAIKPSAIVRLASAKPKVSAKSDPFIAGAVCDKTPGCKKTKNWAIYAIDWNKVKFGIQVGPSKKLSSRVTIDTHKFSGYGSPIQIAPEYETIFNCGESTITYDMESSELKEERVLNKVQNEKEITNESRVKITVSAKGGAVNAAAEAEFKTTVRSKHTELREIERRAEEKRARSYNLTVPALSAVEIGVAPSIRIQNYEVSGRAIYNTPLYAVLPELLKVRPIYFGMLSEFIDEADLSLPLPATVEVTSVHVVTTGSNPKSFGNTEACEVARDGYLLGKPLDSGVASTVDTPTAAGGVFRAAPMRDSKMHPIADLPFTAVTSSECKADAEGDGNLNDDHVDVEFDIEVNSCSIQNLSSTGQLRYALRVKDEEGRQDIIGPFFSRWHDRKGEKFEHSDRADFRDGAVSELLDVIDEEVVDCTCHK